MQHQQPHKTRSIAEEDENDENETFDERSTTRASGSSLKRKMSGDMTDKNKKHPGTTTVIYVQPADQYTSTWSTIIKYRQGHRQRRMELT
eukprot:4542156-Amphidinium_carterae.1